MQVDAPAAGSAPAAPAAPAAAEAAPAAGAAAAEAADPYSAAASHLLTGSALEQAVNGMIEMGFAREEVMRAMRAAYNNPERAVEYLMSGKLVADCDYAAQSCAGMARKLRRAVWRSRQALCRPGIGVAHARQVTVWGNNL